MVGNAYYHVTLVENVPSIVEKGLVPMIGERSEEFGEAEPAVYLFPSGADMDTALSSWLGEWYDENYGEDCKLAILRVSFPENVPIFETEAGFEVVCNEVVPASCIEFFDEMGNELNLKKDITLYRYELYCDGEDQEVGFLVGIEDLGLSVDEEISLLEPFDKELANPITPGMQQSVSFFTEEGNEKFRDAISNLVSAYEDSIFEVKVVALRLPLSMLEQAVYQDDDQVCLPKELYNQALDEFMTKKKAVFDCEFRTVIPKDIGPIYHVGTMDISLKSMYSLEGNGLSISNCPDVWQRITDGISHGDTFLLSKEDMKLLDYYALTDVEKRKITDWAIENGYVVTGTLYKYIFDDEAGNECYILFDLLEEALCEADEDIDCVVPVDGLLPTDKMKEHSLVRVDLANVFDFITSFYAEQVLNYDGVYWDEMLDVSAYSAPRGVVFNSKLDSFHVKNITDEKKVSLAQQIVCAAVVKTEDSVEVRRFIEKGL